MKSADSDQSLDPARIEAVFHEAADLEPAEQELYLARACGGDVRLESAVRALLDAGRHAATVWDRGALELEARHSALAARAPQPDEFFGPYRIVRRIAAGGMSLVYEAIRDDTEFHKRVAIKFVQHGIDDDAGIEHFRSERQILAELEHPYIARLIDGGTTEDGLPYIVMEYVAGVPIDRFTAQRGLSLGERLTLFLDVCDAVQYAHRHLVVHRDVKPANILVTSDGVPKLLDFGIAKMLAGDARAQATTVHALTPEYASPEQVLGRTVGTSSDIYSLGVLLFVLLANRLPYRADSTRAADLVRAICEEEPLWQPAGLIHGDLQSILARALRKEPERRYLSVEQLAADIRRYIAGLPVSARPDTVGYRLRKFVVRRALPLAAVCALAIAIAGGTLSTLRQSRRAERRFEEVRSLAHSILFEIYDSISQLTGSVSARRLVVSRAQQYLDSLAREAGDDPGLTRELAESYLRLGDVMGRPYTPNLGDTAGALATYQKALTLLERESARHRDDTALQEELSEAYMNVAVIFMRQKKAPESMAAATRGIAVIEPLTKRFPHSAVYNEKLAHAYMRLGQGQDIAANQTGASISAKQQVVATYRKALAVLEAGGPHDEPFWQVRLSTMYFYVGYPLGSLGDRLGDVRFYQEALDSALKGDAINRRLIAAQPDEVNYIRRLADGLVDIGNLRWKCCRDVTGALHDLEEARNGFQKVRDRDPQNLEARRDVANVYKILAIVLEETNRATEAMDANRKALEIYEELGRTDPTSAENAGYLAEVRARIAALERAPGTSR
jgi:eukaryotic-like serine/threonine-protein kinase